MRIKKIISVLLLVAILISITTFTFAVDPDSYKPSGMDSGDSQKVGELTGDILASIRAIGIIIAVVILTIIGLKYIFSSIEEKAEYKQTILPYVIGCFLLASATTIPSIVYDLADYDGFVSPEEVSDAANDIINNNVNMEEFTDKEIRSLYASQYVAEDLVSRTEEDPRSQGKGQVMTLEEAINDLSEYKRKIYNEAKRRNLIGEDGKHLK